MQKKVKILKVKFDNTTLKKATKTIMEWAEGSKQKRISTPNPEFLLEAQKNQKFLKAINTCDLNIPDGTGILWAASYLNNISKFSSNWTKRIKWLFSLSMILLHPKYIRKILPERVTGVDLMQEICKESVGKKLKIFLLGASEGTAAKAKEVLEKRHKGIKIVGTFAGSPKLKDEKVIIEMIKKSDADILFVAYGAPASELWIQRNLKRMPSVRIAIGVGGSFNFIAGIKKRAPRFMQKLGLEWIYRLIQEPSRIKRIYNATVRFPLLVLKKSLH